MSLAINELSTVIADTVEVTAGGEVFKLKRFSLRQVKHAAAHAALITALYKAKEAGDASIFDVITTGGDSIGELLSIATAKPVDWCEDLDLAEVGELLLTIVEVNFNFFVNALSPLIQGWKERAAKMAAVVAEKTAAATTA
jgi:hypothetical protein